MSFRLRCSIKLLLSRMNVPFGLKAEMLTASKWQMLSPLSPLATHARTFRIGAAPPPIHAP